MEFSLLWWTILDDNSGGQFQVTILGFRLHLHHHNLTWHHGSLTLHHHLYLEHMHACTHARKHTPALTPPEFALIPLLAVISLTSK